MAGEGKSLHRISEGRRRLLRSSAGALLLAQPVLLGLAAAPGRSTNVRTAGARGDGLRDDTAAFQKAIDAMAPTGGTVEVPAGRYLIDPVRSVRLRSGVNLRMAPGARLMAKPNAATRAYVLLAEGVNGVEISGGEIFGDRDAHLGSTGEWGHGLAIRGSSHVTVRNVTISRCWGDGISIGAASQGRAEARSSSDILIAGVRCLGNRRQGLTIGRSRRVRVIDSEFSDTHGTKPEYGIDIEPDRPGRAEGITIERCVLRGNRGGGIQVYHRVSNVEIRDCTIEGNGFGIYTIATSDGVIAGNRINGNRHAGIALRSQTSGYHVEANHFAGNNTRLRLPGSVRRTSKGHVQVAQDARGNKVGANRYE
ncbi:MAG TPA: right-handed parallel beta-helix repeat-containing protein [Lysobacter sp.]|nr:right-handed parallel beta-helix repeat-containing protein [Lysobacter sp.]